QDTVWVGAPLRAHRRCDEPMFSISNAVAYDGLMVFGTPPRSEFTHARRSVWLDIRSGHTDGKWVPAEGTSLQNTVTMLLDRGLAAEEIFVVSPFRQVANEARKILKTQIPADRVGTVHTTQGKESDVVIMILGTHPDASGSQLGH
ncbi:MAG: hypothetical protein HOQ05_03200, partial [Corynebacteriales bacterium]|nr:hypothetical protein [Mycobacteriales bacterium]